MCILRSVYLLAVVLILSISDGDAQIDQSPLYFNRLTTQEGLSSQNYNDFIFRDSKGFIWISSVDGLNRYDGHAIRQYLSDPSDPYSINNNLIYTGFFEDSQSNLWFSTALGIQKYVREKDHFESFPLNRDTSSKAEIKQETIQLLYLDKEKNELWVRADSSLYIQKMDAKEPARYLGRQLSKRWIKVLPSPLSRKSYLLVTYEKNNLLIDHFAPNDAEEELVKFKSDTVALSAFPQVVYPDSKAILWIGTGKGLMTYNLETEEKERYEDGPTGIKAISLDKDGQVWMGTEKGELYIFDPSVERFGNALRWVDDQQIKKFEYEIGSLHYFSDHTLWVSSPGRAVFFTSRNKRKFKAYLQYSFGEDPSSSNIKDLAVDQKGRVWCLSLSGITVINPNGQLAKEIKLFEELEIDKSSLFPFHVMCDQSGGIWISSSVGLFYASSIDSPFKQVDERSFVMVYQLSDGTLLGARQKGGIFELSADSTSQSNAPFWEGISEGFYNQLYEDEQGRIYLFQMANKLLIYERSNGNNLTLIRAYPLVPQVTDIVEDVKTQQLWIGTKEGLFQLPLEPRIGELKKNAINGLLRVNGIQQQDSTLWLSTPNGLIKYDTIANTNHAYMLADGLQNMEFNFGSALKLPSGLLAFGGTNGLNIFDPDNIQSLDVAARPMVTDVRINGQTLLEADLQCELSGVTNPELVKALELQYYQNTLELNFAALEYSDPSAARFQYRLRGLDKEWIRSEEERSVRYADLRPGDYTFELIAANSDGVWSEEIHQIKINVKHPWFWGPYAWIIYFLLALMSAYIYYRRRLAKALELAEARKWKELISFKDRFISNFTHELKTPLTSVSLSAIRLNHDKEERIDILHSVEEMKQIINRIHGLSQIEVGSMKITPEKRDIVQFLDFQIRSYTHLAEMKQLKLHFYKKIDHLIMDFDPEKIKDIVRNLLSNAIKYNRPGGEINVTLEKKETDQLVLLVEDTGLGIEEDEIEKIFGRFYQGEQNRHLHLESSGIGLAYIRELVGLLEGKISASSKKGQGSAFKVVLPIHNDPKVALSQSDPIIFSDPLSSSEEDAAKPGPTEAQGRKMNLLIVEDDLSILKSLLSLLKSKYNVYSAMDGEKGVELAISMVPDIIISDVMMPKKDGYELCEELKAHKTTSHIPIVLLTAMSSRDSKLKGLQKGADAYLEKPFNEEELTIRLQKLIEIRLLIQERYKEGAQNLSPLVSSNIDDEFIIRLKKEIREDPQGISVKKLGEKLNMTRQQLYNKLHALTDKGPQRFITRVKLEWAYELLSDSNQNFNVQQVCYHVGFKDPAHFSRSFKELFGHAPSILNK